MDKGNVVWHTQLIFFAGYLIHAARALKQIKDTETELYRFVDNVDKVWLSRKRMLQEYSEHADLIALKRTEEVEPIKKKVQ